MLLHLKPAQLFGTVAAPPSKSMAHRAVICAGLARGRSRITNLALSKDVKATIAAMQQLGARITVTPQYTDVVGRGGFATILSPIHCGESGSTLRFLVPIVSLTGQQITLTGAGRLFQRPLGIYQSIFAAQRLSFRQTSSSLTLQGSISPGDYMLAGNVSSQFISGLLFSLPLLARGSTLSIVQPFESRSYVQMTLAALADFGVQVQWSSPEKTALLIAGRQKYRSRDYTVEGDYSQAAFFAVLGAVCGGITVAGLRQSTTQGDAAILPILQRCGAVFQWEGDRVVFYKSKLTAPIIDVAACPVLGPILLVLALFCQGETVITNAARLRIKESDRIGAMQQELAKFGADVQEQGGTVRVQGCQLHAPAVVHSHNDHRIVMSLCIAALAAELPLAIDGAGAVAKSWPEFFAVLQSLGASVQVGEEQKELPPQQDAPPLQQGDTP